MTMSEFTWTNPTAACGAVTAVFVSSGLATTADLKVTQSGSTWFVEPIDYNTVNDHTFSLKMQGVDNAGVAYEETHGPYVLKVICPSNVGVSETSPITSQHDQVAGGSGAYTLTLTSADPRCPVKTYQLSSSSPAGVTQSNCGTPANSAYC